MSKPCRLAVVTTSRWFAHGFVVGHAGYVVLGGSQRSLDHDLDTWIARQTGEVQIAFFVYPLFPSAEHLETRFNGCPVHQIQRGDCRTWPWTKCQKRFSAVAWDRVRPLQMLRQSFRPTPAGPGRVYPEAYGDDSTEA